MQKGFSLLTETTQILVTGGCGYIGSHVCAQLSQAGYKPLVLDDLSTGSEEALLHGEKLVKGDFGDRELIQKIFREHKIKTIFHFAASIVVEDSVKEPLRYYENNSIKFFTLLEEAKRFGIQQFVLSSTAAVYGMQSSDAPVKETCPLNPLSPYGRSKVFDEWLLEDLSKVSSLNFVTLRYFNVAGAGAEGRLGQRAKGTHLIKVACEAALKRRDSLTVFGTDYKTRDGTCVRDYIHVEDLASAHIAALKYLEAGGKSKTLNCGYSHGFSVKEVLEAFQSSVGVSFPIEEGDRRPGDAPYLVADSEEIFKTLDWKVNFDDLPQILKSAWEWEKNR